MMRKLTVVILVLALACGVVLATAGCSSDVDLPGRSWAQKETLYYEVYKDNVLYGAMLITTERLEKGDHVLNATGETHTVSSHAAGGTRVTIAVSDLSENVVMYSESLLDGFTSLASYKKVAMGDTQYTVKARYDGKHYRYSLNGGSEKKIKEKSSFVDNELIYTVVRCYSVDSGSYSASYKVSDAVNGSIESISISTAKTDVYYHGTIHQNDEGNTITAVKTIDGDGNVAYVDSVKGVQVKFQRNEAPVGNPAYVTYAVSGNGGLDVNGEGSQNTKSTHIPLEIIENNMTYRLSKVDLNS